MNNIIHLLKPILPEQFDKNEFYVLAITIIVGISFFVLHKRFQLLLKTEMICLYVFNLLFAQVGDRILAEPPLDFYNTLDRDYGELFDSILQVFVYPFPIMIAVQIFWKFKPNSLIYILLCAFILSMFEWISVRIFDVFQYNNWSTWYSFGFYCMAVLVNLIFYKKIHKIIKERRSTNFKKLNKETLG